MMHFDRIGVLRSLPFSYLAVLPDASFTIAEASDAYLDAVCIARESIVGRPMFEVFPDNPADLRSHGPVRLRESFGQVLRTRAPHAMRIQRYDIARADGSVDEKFWLPTNYPVFDQHGGVTCIIHRVQDVTLLSRSHEHPSCTADAAPGRRRIDDRLLSKPSDLQQVSDLIVEEETRWLDAVAKAEEAGEKLALAVDAADIGTFYCPLPLGKIVWNDVCKSHFFLPPEAEVDFELFYAMLHPDDRVSIQAAIIECVFHHRPYDVEYRAVAADGRQRWIRAKGRAYYDSNDEPTRFDGITIDITLQKEAETGLRVMDRQKDEFLAMLAHELRNPLAPIRAAAQLMASGPVDAERTSKACEVINRQVGHMTALIDDLLDVSRVTRGLVMLDRQPVALHEIAADALEQMRPLLASKNHALHLELGANTLTVCGDRKRLVQVLANLLHNAAKYTPEGGRLSLELSRQGAHAVARISDDGIGIAASLLPRIFDLFTQASRTPDRRQGGLGVGLALVRTLVDLHEGEVSCSSAGPGHGAVFTVRLPLHVKGATVAPQADLHTLRAQTPLAVMIVDDNVDAAVMLAYAVEGSGHQVRVEYGSHDALNRLQSGRYDPIDVCLLDIGLPEIDGNEVARRLRADPHTRDMALIAVTGYGQPRDVDAAINAGFDRCLIKPVDLGCLTHLLAQISANKAQGEPLRGL